MSFEDMQDRRDLHCKYVFYLQMYLNKKSLK